MLHPTHPTTEVKRPQGPRVGPKQAEPDLMVVDWAPMLPLDTSQEANDIQLKILKRMSGTERLRMAIDLSEFARKLAFARIEHDHPGLSKAQLIREFLHCVMFEKDYPRSLK